MSKKSVKPKRLKLESQKKTIAKKTSKTYCRSRATLSLSGDLSLRYRNGYGQLDQLFRLSAIV